MAKRRRRPPGRKIYSIDYLLSKQPGGLKKRPHYDLMLQSLRDAPEVLNLRFNKRCYSLLHNGVIRPEHLENFYRTYHLPRHPFFPLFFMIKSSYLKEREEKKQQREKDIASMLEALPPAVLSMFHLIIEMEEYYNTRSQTPLYKQCLYPKSKKQALTYKQRSSREWHFAFQEHFKKLRIRYRNIPEIIPKCLLASFLLNCLPSSFEKRPLENEVNRNFRILSKNYHPDRGGDGEWFMLIKEAKDSLLE